MERKHFRVAILGCGNRGAETYGRLMHAREEYTISALCELDGEKLQKYAELFGVPREGLFTDEEEFLRERRADVLVIATQDNDHVRECLRALELGYDILLEKPITDSEEACMQLLAAQKKYGGKVLVCHVLRYAPAFVKVAQLIEEGAIGRLVSIQALEQVAYWHQAHSYVRGNWRRRDQSAPMILAKCCHDLDLLQYYAGARCESISSVGDLTWFRPENAPKGAAARCLQCQYAESCPYSAKRIYLDRFEEEGRPARAWPYTQLTSAFPITPEALTEALRDGPYGRCVYACDNDVVDHQMCSMRFENGVTATLTMMGFSAHIGRVYEFFGTMGEIDLNEERDEIIVKRFSQPDERIAISSITTADGHGGGDAGLVAALYGVLTGEDDGKTTLAASVESHLMGIRAEQSRLAGGACMNIH